MNPGDMRQRLIFQRSNSKDDDGFPLPKPVVYTRAWGSLKTLKGKTKYQAAQVQMEHNREFTIRYQSILEDNVRPKGLTVLWRKREHDIESIENDDGLNATMTVTLKAVT